MAFGSFHLFPSKELSKKESVSSSGKGLGASKFL
jgi:hypothetical protein